MKVTATPKAARDLEEWIDQIAQDNTLAAEAFQNRIRQCVEVIRSHPEAGRRHPKRSTIRKLVEDPIIIYYEVFEDRIEILRFWHSARNRAFGSGLTVYCSYEHSSCAAGSAGTSGPSGRA